MRDNGFLRFHRAAEAAGYPAMLLVTMVSLTTVVVPIVLLALMQAAWTFVVAVLGLVAACAILAGAIWAALSDRDDADAGRAGEQPSSPALEAPVPLPRRDPASSPRRLGRKAA
jgi:high-affinity Fe2+/Pb2+ permease